MDSFEDLDAQLEQLQAQLKNDIQKVWFVFQKKRKILIWNFTGSSELSYILQSSLSVDNRDYKLK